MPPSTARARSLGKGPRSGRDPPPNESMQSLRNPSLEAVLRAAPPMTPSAPPSSLRLVEARPSGRDDDGELADRLRQGDERASAELYDRCYEVVERSILRVLRARDEEFEDFVQLAFERVLRSILRGRYVGGFSLARWASSIATHVAIDALRRRAVQRRHFQGGYEREGVSLGESAERRLLVRAELERIHRVLGKMREAHAETLLLHDVYGYDLEETAAVLGVTVAAAQSRLVRGRKELLRRLGADGAGGTT